MQKKAPVVHQLLQENKALKKKIRELEASGAERMQTEQALRTSELIYKTIFETTGTMMLIVEEDMTIYLASGGLEQLTGYTTEEIIGTRRWTDFVDPGDMEKMTAYHQLRRVHPEGAPKSYEFRLTRKDGGVRNIILTVDAIPGTRRSVASLL
ncbi:MAG TPA: PAS domain S-box protein, partial [Smithellaceae bacterium]|nr:PAS domain S-box protein [Smithellaceae bacterium]